MNSCNNGIPDGRRVQHADYLVINNILDLVFIRTVIINKNAVTMIPEKVGMQREERGFAVHAIVVIIVVIVVVIVIVAYVHMNFINVFALILVVLILFQSQHTPDGLVGSEA